MIFRSLIFACMAAPVAAQSAAPALIPPSDPRIQIFGRYDDRDPLHPRLAYPGSGFAFRMQGRTARLEVGSETPTSALTLVVDHGAPVLQLLKKGDNEVELPAFADDGPHTIEVYKRTETWQGILTVNGIQLGDGTAVMDPPPMPERKLIFIGDSVTCGAGVDNNAQCKPDPDHPANNVYESYGMLLGRRLDAQSELVCYGGRGLERDYRGLSEADNVLNAPQFLPLSVPADDAGKRAPWDAARFQPDAVFISLGTNDFNLEKTKPLDEKKWVAEYVAFIRAVRHDYPRALILVTEGAIVTNPLLRQMIRQAATDSLDPRILYTPSVHYPGNGCDGHPTRSQQLHMTDDLEPVFRHNLGW